MKLLLNLSTSSQYLADLHDLNADQPKRSKKQAQEDPIIQPAEPITPSPAPDPSQPSGSDPSELAKKLEGMVYEDFDPLLLKQNEAAQKLEFETYDAALDEFYAKVPCLLPFLVRFYKIVCKQCLSY